MIFLSAADPNEVNNTYASFGFKPMEHSYFKIDCDKLDHSLLATLVEPKRGEQGSEDFTPFDILQMEKYAKIPERSLQYYKQRKSEGYSGKHMYVYCYIAHIFYKGPIDISDCPIVKLVPSPITI